MPRLQDIERFKRDLAALSHEAEVLERWGEKPETITPPEGAAAAPSLAQRVRRSVQARSRRNPARGETRACRPISPPSSRPPLDRDGDEESRRPIDDDLAALLGSSDEAERAAPS